MRRKRNHFLAAILLAALTALGGGCGQTGESTSAISEGLSAPSAAEVLSLDVPGDWHVTSNPSRPLTANANHTQGTHSLAVNAQNYVSIQSSTFSVASAVTGPVSYDLFLPPSANPSWAGATQLFVDCHSHSIFNQYLGQTELTGLPTGKFNAVQFSLPTSIATALSHGCSDLSFTIILNVPSNSTGTYLLDNLQLDGPPLTSTCSTTPAASTASGVTGPTTTFQSTLNRPDLGTLTLTATTVVGAPSNETYAFTLNGNPLYQFQQQGSIGGVTTRSDAYFAPITGVHQVTSTLNGATLALIVDGRQTVPTTATADPTTVKFADGRAAPRLDIPAAIGDAIVELMNDAAAKLPACAAGSTSTPPQLIAAAGTDSGHPSGDSGSGCTTCEIGCDGAEGACLAGAAVVTIACGPFAFFCAPAAGGACIAGYDACLGLCHRSGTDCCPVDCGGASQATNPIGACCESGESCLKRSTSGHVALCCSSGQTPCGGTQCCGSDTTCMPTGASTSACCKPSQINSQGVCCPNGIGANGQCCGLFGSCGTEADCSPSLLGACSNGCCTLG
jgi:hypothetical protein